MATLRKVNILPSYPHTACSLAEACFVLGQANLSFSNPHGCKDKIGNVGWAPALQYLAGHTESLRQQLSEVPQQPCSSAARRVHPCCKANRACDISKGGWSFCAKRFGGWR